MAHHHCELFDPLCDWIVRPVRGSSDVSKFAAGRWIDVFCRKQAFLDGSVQLHRAKEEESDMPDVTIVYWRDIPAQVIVGKGRRGAKRVLAERFEQAIDRAAMKVNAESSDAYMAEWRKAKPYAVEGEQADVAETEAQRLEAEYDKTRIKALIDNDGWA
jgi:hypothetical protein